MLFELTFQLYFKERKLFLKGVKCGIDTDTRKFLAPQNLSDDDFKGKEKWWEHFSSQEYFFLQRVFCLQIFWDLQFFSNALRLFFEGVSQEFWEQAADGGKARLQIAKRLIELFCESHGRIFLAELCGFEIRVLRCSLICLQMLFCTKQLQLTKAPVWFLVFPRFFLLMLLRFIDGAA